MYWFYNYVFFYKVNVITKNFPKCLYKNGTMIYQIHNIDFKDENKYIQRTVVGEFFIFLNNYYFKKN